MRGFRARCSCASTFVTFARLVRSRMVATRSVVGVLLGLWYTASCVLCLFGAQYLFIENAFPEGTSYLQRIEVPQGCGVEFPVVFIYRERAFRDPKFCSWVLAYTEFRTKTVEFVSAAVFEKYRLSCLSSEMILNIRLLDLVRVLGSLVNADVVERLLRVTEGTNFATLPEEWSDRDEEHC